MTEYTKSVIQIIKEIPSGKVLSYGQVAKRAGNPKGARAVVFILRSRSSLDQLPWHRVVDKDGRLKIKDPEGFQLQKYLLESEGVIVNEVGVVNMKKYFW